MKKILVVHGPNLNLIGKREPSVYGRESFAQINVEILYKIKNLGMDGEVFQSNHEGDIIDKLHAAVGEFDGIIINAAAFTHYSIAIRDAIAAVCLPTIEVHISNVYKREDFRHKSIIAPVCEGVIAGFGKTSYLLAVDALKEILE